MFGWRTLKTNLYPVLIFKDFKSVLHPWRIWNVLKSSVIKSSNFKDFKSSRTCNVGNFHNDLKNFKTPKALKITLSIFWTEKSQTVNISDYKYFNDVWTLKALCLFLMFIKYKYWKKSSNFKDFKKNFYNEFNVNKVLKYSNIASKLEGINAFKPYRSKYSKYFKGIKNIKWLRL